MKPLMVILTVIALIIGSILTIMHKAGVSMTTTVQIFHGPVNQFRELHRGHGRDTADTSINNKDLLSASKRSIAEARHPSTRDHGIS
jgi:hypothetical protein